MVMETLDRQVIFQLTFYIRGLAKNKTRWIPHYYVWGQGRRKTREEEVVRWEWWCLLWLRVGWRTNSPCIGQLLTEAAVAGPIKEKGAVVHDSRRNRRERKRSRERLAGDSRNESASSDHDLFVSQLVNHVNIEQEKKKEKKQANKLTDWQEKKEEREKDRLQT